MSQPSSVAGVSTSGGEKDWLDKWEDNWTSREAFEAMVRAIADSSFATAWDNNSKGKAAKEALKKAGFSEELAKVQQAMIENVSGSDVAAAALSGLDEKGRDLTPADKEKMKRKAGPYIGFMKQLRQDFQDHKDKTGVSGAEALAEFVDVVRVMENIKFKPGLFSEISDDLPDWVSASL